MFDHSGDIIQFERVGNGGQEAVAVSLWLLVWAVGRPGKFPNPPLMN